MCIVTSKTSVAYAPDERKPINLSAHAVLATLVARTTARSLHRDCESTTLYRREDILPYPILPFAAAALRVDVDQCSSLGCIEHAANILTAHQQGCHDQGETNHRLQKREDRTGAHFRLSIRWDWYKRLGRAMPPAVDDVAEVFVQIGIYSKFK